MGASTEAIRTLAARFPPPLIKPDVQITRIRLSDWTSPSDSRTRLHPDTTQLENTQPAVDRIPRKARISAARPHLMASPEVVTYAFISVIVDRPIRCGRRAVAEVGAPTPPSLIESVSHLRPCLDVVGYQKASHFLLNSRHTRLGRTRS